MLSQQTPHITRISHSHVQREHTVDQWDLKCNLNVLFVTLEGFVRKLGRNLQLDFVILDSIA